MGIGPVATSQLQKTIDAIRLFRVKADAWDEALAVVRTAESNHRSATVVQLRRARIALREADAAAGKVHNAGFDLNSDVRLEKALEREEDEALEREAKLPLPPAPEKAS